MITPKLLTTAVPAPAPFSARLDGDPLDESIWLLVPTSSVVVAPAPVVMSTTAVAPEVPRPIAWAPLLRLITPPPVELVMIALPPADRTSALALITRPPVPATAWMPAEVLPATLALVLTLVEPAPVEEAKMPVAPPITTALVVTEAWPVPAVAEMPVPVWPNTVEVEVTDTDEAPLLEAAMPLVVPKIAAEVDTRMFDPPVLAAEMPVPPAALLAVTVLAAVTVIWPLPVEEALMPKPPAPRPMTGPLVVMLVTPVPAVEESMPSALWPVIVPSVAMVVAPPVLLALTPVVEPVAGPVRERSMSPPLAPAMTPAPAPPMIDEPALAAVTVTSPEPAVVAERP